MKIADMSSPRLRAPHGARQGQSRLQDNRSLKAAAGAPPRGRRHLSWWGYGGISPHRLSFSVIFMGNLLTSVMTLPWLCFPKPGHPTVATVPY